MTKQPLGRERRTKRLRVWRRTHRDGVVAEVSPLLGMGTWEGCVKIKRRTLNLGRPFTDLVEAQASADRLAQVIAPHACDEGCKPWMPVERRVDD
jgi:hypothetical protein